VRKPRAQLFPNKDAIRLRHTARDLTVMSLHYSADEHKNPAHASGKKWLIKALSGYDGINDPRWLKEMELQYFSGSGQKVFPELQRWLSDSQIFIDREPDLTHAKFYGSYDHGYNSPACYLVHAILPGSQRFTLWEFYSAGVEVPYIARVIKGETVTTTSGRRLEGNPYAGRETFKICDPEIMRSNQVMVNGPNKSVAWMFSQNGVHFQKGIRGDDATVAAWLNGNLWLNPQEPEYFIHRRCKNLIWELGLLQRTHLSPHASRYKNQPETFIDKDNHAWDALKYWLKRFPAGSKLTEKPKQEADFNFWMQAAKKPRLKTSYVRQF
jgi:hypothetical protein